MTRRTYPTMASIEAALGADHVAWIRRQPHPAITAECRATGMWDANELDMMAAYKALAALLRIEAEHETADPMWAADEAALGCP